MKQRSIRGAPKGGAWAREGRKRACAAVAAAALSTPACRAPFSASAQTPSSISNPVRRVIDARVRLGIHRSVVLGVVDHGRIEIYGVGRIGPGESRPPSEDTVYEIGSVTKVFTGLLLARGVVEGRLRLEDRLGSVLEKISSLPPSARSITLRQLATHTSGLPRDPPNLRSGDYEPTNPFAHFGEESLRRALVSSAPIVPSTDPRYSNFGFGLLGWALSKTRALPYPAVLKRDVLEPLSMVSTTIEASSGDVAQGFVYQHRVPAWHFRFTAGAGALRSTARDMLRFLRAQLEPGSTPLAEALRLAQHAHWRGSRRSVGLGWGRYPLDGGGTLFRHNGGTGGFRSFVGFVPERGRGVVVLSNSAQAGVDDLGLHELDAERYPLTLTMKRPVATEVGRFLDGAEAVASRSLAELVDLGALDTHRRHLNLLGYTYLKAGRPAAARQCFLWNTELHPDWGDGFDSLGDGYTASGMLSEALDAYLEALRREPEHAHARARVGQLRSELGVASSTVSAPAP